MKYYKIKFNVKAIFSLFLVALATSSYGQKNYIDVGAEGGLNISSLRGNEFLEESHGTHIGYSAGIFVQYNLKKLLSIRSGVSYELKGSSFEFDLKDNFGNSIGKFNGKESFEYLIVPLLMRATIGKKVKYFANAGPYIGFLLSQKESTDAYSLFPETNINRTEYFKKTETGISLGLGITYDFKNKFAVSFEARNNIGLTNTSDKPVYNNGEIKTNVFNFLFGFSYKIGQRKNIDN